MCHRCFNSFFIKMDSIVPEIVSNNSNKEEKERLSSSVKKFIQVVAICTAGVIGASTATSC